jgi:hypothetical protein
MYIIKTFRIQGIQLYLKHMTSHLILLSKQTFQGGPDHVWSLACGQHETINQLKSIQEEVMWPHPFGSPIWSSQLLM